MNLSITCVSLTKKPAYQNIKQTNSQDVPQKALLPNLQKDSVSFSFGSSKYLKPLDALDKLIKDCMPPILKPSDNPEKYLKHFRDNTPEEIKAILAKMDVFAGITDNEGWRIGGGFEWQKLASETETLEEAEKLAAKMKIFAKITNNKGKRRGGCFELQDLASEIGTVEQAEELAAKMDVLAKIADNTEKCIGSFYTLVDLASKIKTVEQAKALAAKMKIFAKIINDKGNRIPDSYDLFYLASGVKLPKKAKRSMYEEEITCNEILKDSSPLDLDRLETSARTLEETRKLAIKMNMLAKITTYNYDKPLFNNIYELKKLASKIKTIKEAKLIVKKIEQFLKVMDQLKLTDYDKYKKISETEDIKKLLLE